VPQCGYCGGIEDDCERVHGIRQTRRIRQSWHPLQKELIHSYPLERHKTENSKQIFPEKELRGLSPNFHIHVSVSDIYIPTVSLPLLLQKKYVDRSWEYINRSQTYKCGNWTEAAQFLFWEHINGIFVSEPLI
jgi:hypothetical protein